MCEHYYLPLPHPSHESTELEFAAAAPGVEPHSSSKLERLDAISLVAVVLVDLKLEQVEIAHLHFHRDFEPAVHDTAPAYINSEHSVMMSATSLN